MLEGIPIAAIGAISAPGLVGLVVVLLLLGRIVPRAALLDKIAEAERWRSAYETERAARNTADSQTEELLQLAKLSHSLIVAIHRMRGAPDVVSQRTPTRGGGITEGSG
jgi:hypothetical protein